MKKAIVYLLAALAFFTGLNQFANAAAVTFTNLPAAVSNTYTGTITLLISNVPTGHTVVVQKYIDVNTNGIIDGRDVLVQQFSLTDGQAGMVIGGVTNYNVPGDLNATTGAITATLNFNNGDFMQNLVAHYFYRLTSPVGDFTPLTNSFTVTNFPYAQKFTGNVVSNSTSTTLSNAFVLVFPPPRAGNHNGPGQPLGGTVANSAGAYSIAMPTGTYTLMAFETNYVGSFKTAPALTLTSAANLNSNLSLTVATTSISGSIVDAANNAIVLPGIFTPVSSTNGLLAAAFSDTNGNYSVRVTASQWSVGSDDSGLIIHGYVGYQNSATNVVAPATGVTLAFPKATALFYGTFTNSSGSPLVGLDVNDYETASNLYAMDGYTDANGNYFVGALGFGSSDSWQLQLSGENTPTNYVYSQPSFFQNGTNLNAGQALHQNFTAILATNLITGNVKDSSSNNIVGVGVGAYTNINGTVYQSYVDTDANGNYTLNVFNGPWDVSLNCNGGNDSLSQLGNYNCPGDQFSTVAGKNVTNNFIVQLCSGVTIVTTSPLPVGEVNAFYNQSIQASDCSGNYNWSQTGGTLPGGLNLAGGGSSYVLSGFPTSSGTFNFTVRVDDGSGNFTNQSYAVTISNALQITTGSLPNGTNGSAYSQTLQATGGQPPYTWSLLSGSLPGNLNLTPGSGLISGTATNAGTFSFTAQVTDNFGGTNNQALAISINTTNPPPAVGISSAGGQFLIYYPLSGSNYVLQSSTNVNGPWLAASNGTPVTAITFSNTAPVQFFRLH